MSGHSHFATIKRTKEANDAKKGRVFSKYAKEIAIAVKTGGGVDPEFNYKLRMIVEKARSFNMPKDNIDRAISRGTGGEALEVINYEGFGPCGVSVIVETATDNRNRTAQEIKNIIEKGGGSLGGPGSVSYNFENRGLLIVKKENDFEEQMLKLIDCGAEDVEEAGDEIEVYTQPDKVKEVRDKVEELGFSVKSAELCMEPKTFKEINDSKDASKILSFMEQLDECEDVSHVYANFDISDDIMKEIEQ
ncbi:MAG: YebC/PmpR family DNA-binding transcriptional regulator [bacterium]|nr:YebC/PmpR family DNA-binding transcriptional regulator [bacterium]